MNPCPVCTKENAFEHRICQFCGSALAHPTAGDRPSVPTNDDAGAGTEPKPGATTFARVGEPAVAATSRKKPAGAATGKTRAAGTEGNLFLALVLGLVVTLALYATFWGSRSLPVVNMFFRHGSSIAWVPPTELFLSAWVLSLLALKWFKFRREHLPFAQAVLPASPAQIMPSQVPSFIRHIESLPAASRNSFLVRRIRRALAHFQVHSNITEVSSFLNAQAEADAIAVASSYIIPRVFIWAIPILGFAGTVIGIGLAIDGLSGLNGIDALAKAMPKITGGLAGAFETTLIALVLSMLLMFPMSLIEKGEQGLLSRVDEYCSDELVHRLWVSLPAGADTEEQARQFAQLVVKQLIGAAPQLGSSIALAFVTQSRDMIVTGLSKFKFELDSAATNVRANSDELRRQLLGTASTLQTAVTAAESLADNLKARQTRLADSMEKFGERVEVILQRSEQVAATNAKTTSDATREFAKMNTDLAAHATTQSEALSALGDRLVQQLDGAHQHLAAGAQTLGHAIDVQARTLEQMEHRGNVQAVRAALMHAVSALDAAGSRERGGNGSDQPAAG